MGHRSSYAYLRIRFPNFNKKKNTIAVILSPPFSENAEKIYNSYQNFKYFFYDKF